MRKVLCITCHQLTNSLIYTVQYFSSFAENIIIIHVDHKSDLKDFLFLKKENVFFLDDRVDVKWGGVSQIRATLNLLSMSLRFDYDYLFFISGDDLPCKDNDSINFFIKGIDYYNMIHFQDERNSIINPVERVKYNYPNFFFHREYSLSKRIKCKFFKFFRSLFMNKNLLKSGLSHNDLYKGTNWFSFNRKTVFQLCDFLDSNSWYYDIFINSYCCDEVFFHTLIKLLDVRDLYHDFNMKNDALRYIDWESGPEFPKILTEVDIINIKESNCLFARKFHRNISIDIFNDLID